MNKSRQNERSSNERFFVAILNSSITPSSVKYCHEINQNCTLPIVFIIFPLFLFSAFFRVLGSLTLAGLYRVGRSVIFQAQISTFLNTIFLVKFFYLLRKIETNIAISRKILLFRIWVFSTKVKIFLVTKWSLARSWANFDPARLRNNLVHEYIEIFKVIFLKCEFSSKLLNWQQWFQNDRKCAGPFIFLSWSLRISRRNKYDESAWKFNFICLITEWNVGWLSHAIRNRTSWNTASIMRNRS